VLRVPKGLDAERISASMSDGVLTLRLPKPEAPKPRRIEITGTGQPTIEGSESGSERELVGSAS
jgi:HSP20 family protein